ncbi:MAG: hypothetical protein ACFE0S_06440 [Rhodospirillales bacterium]
MKYLTVLAAVAIVAGCASQPDEIQGHYVSDLQFRNHDCDQLQMEAERVSRRVGELHGQLKETADNDAAQMGVGLVLFWPTLFFLEGGDGPQAQEYARLKGERDAIERVSIKQKCAVHFAPTPTIDPEKTDPEKKDQST